MIGQRVCREFGFVDARGRAQLASCLKALKVLENSGRIALPAPRHHKRAPAPRCLDTAVPAPVDVPDELGDVESLSLVLVQDEERRVLWNTLLHFEHPHWALVLCLRLCKHTNADRRSTRFLDKSEHPNR